MAQWQARLGNWRRGAALALGMAALAGCATAPAGSGPGVVRDASPKPKAPPPGVAAAALMGADAARLDGLLGAPGLVRREGAGEYRRYDLPDCALIVILYPEDGAAPTVSHLEAAAKRGAGAVDLESCLSG